MNGGYNLIKKVKNIDREEVMEPLTPPDSRQSDDAVGSFV